MRIVTGAKAVVFKLKNPARITQVIPTARVFEYQGQQLVAVPHKVDETKTLNSIGFSVPSPVEYYYDWPLTGGRVPFNHQRVTTQFLTMNDRCYVLNDMGCVDSETEYLSPTGWKKISAYTDGQVAQYNPETKQVEFVEPTEYVKKPCSEMVRIKTKYGLDQLLSPEHRVLIESVHNPKKREVLSAAELLSRHDGWLNSAGWAKSRDAIAYTGAAIPVTFIGPEQAGIALSDEQIRVQVAVIADGYFPSATARCIVRLKKSRKKLRLASLLLAAGIPFTERPCQPDGFSVFTFYAPQRSKEFDVSWWSASRAQLAIVADEVFNWDGSTRTGKPTQEFSSTSKASADFIQYVFSSSGRTARVVVDDRANKKSTCYNVIVRDSGKPLMLCSNSSTGEHRAVMNREPSTDGFKYCFVVPSTFLIFRRNGCVFASGNTGKTLSVLWALDYLIRTKQIKRVAIFAPLSTLERVWGDEIFVNFPHLNFQVVHSPSRERRLKMLAVESDVYIINHDGCKVLKEALMARTDIDAVIIDELAAFRNGGTDLFKSMQAIIKPKKYVWGLTGSPIPRAPTDAWAQCRLVTPDTVPKYFGKFRDFTMTKTGPFTWESRSEALNVVLHAMQPSIRFKRDECIDLPPTTYSTRHVEMEDEQKKLYKEMASKLKTEWEGGKVSAVNAAVKAQKLLQIACGVAYDTDGENVIIPNQGRMAVVREIIEEAESKVILFVPFTGSLQRIAEDVGQYASVEVVYGGVPASKRNEIFQSFQTSKTPQVLVAHPECMAHGLTLTAASVIIWYIPTNDGEVYEQACARIARPGQSLHTHIIHLEGSEIERRVYKRLQEKSMTQGTLLHMIKEVMGS